MRLLQERNVSLRGLLNGESGRLTDTLIWFDYEEVFKFCVAMVTCANILDHNLMFSHVFVQECAVCAIRGYQDGHYLYQQGTT